MADDIVTRLQCAYHKGDEPPCEECTFCSARAEIERLRWAGDRLNRSLQLHPSILDVRGRFYQRKAIRMSINEWQEARRG